MSELHFPFLELAIAIPLVGAGLVRWLLWRHPRDREAARRWSLCIGAATFLCTACGWYDFNRSHFAAAHDRWDVLEQWTGHEWFVVDELSAPLLPLASLLYLLTLAATLRTKVGRFSFPVNLLSLAIVLATLSSRVPWSVILLSTANIWPTWFELRSRGKPTRVFALHMLLSAAAMSLGWALVSYSGQRPAPLWALAPLVLGIAIRAGVAPFHCWVADLFENATFGRALLFVTPMSGAYAAVRLLLPSAPDGVLIFVGVCALATAVYAAAMSLVQRDARRFFAYIFLSLSALVLVGLDSVSPIGLTGALTVWLSVGISLAGFGLTIRALEARHGRLSLDRFHGAYENTPELGVCFLLTGLASVGFPGTFGFLSSELLIDGAIGAFPYVGALVVIASAMSGIAVLQAYFHLFTGARHPSSAPLAVNARERVAVLTLAALVLGGAIYPQPGVASRHHAARFLLDQRAVRQPFQADRAANPQLNRSASPIGQAGKPDLPVRQAGKPDLPVRQVGKPDLRTGASHARPR